MNKKEIYELIKKYDCMVDKNIKIKNIKTTVPYDFVCKEGHVFNRQPRFVFVNKKFYCPYCDKNKKENNLWVTHLEITKHLVNKEDGYKCDHKSLKKIMWTCSKCSKKFKNTPFSLIHIENNYIQCNNCQNNNNELFKHILNLIKKNNCLIDNINTEDIKLSRIYTFKCNKGHHFKKRVKNLFVDNKLDCPYCNNKKVLKGFNDLWTTHPKLAVFLKNKEDGYNNLYETKKKLTWLSRNNEEIIEIPSKIKYDADNIYNKSLNNKYAVKQLVKKYNCIIDKDIKINDLKVYKKYNFKCEKGHVFKKELKIAFKNNKLNCPYCNKIKKHKKDNMWITHPEIAKMLKNKENGYIYTINSHINVEWICPDCKNIKITSPHNMLLTKTYCVNCSTCKSYAEKIMRNIFKQLNINFISEINFPWSNKKRYDFYLPDYNCIIETHGAQHYKENGFISVGGRSLFDEQKNDEEKMLLANNNNITNYIIINCKESNDDYIKKSILNSNLDVILNINYDDINWEKCFSEAKSNIVKIICEKFKNGSNIKDLVKEFNYSDQTIRKYLKEGTRLGWCIYKGQRRRRIGQYTINNIKLNEFLTIADASRKLNIHINSINNNLNNRAKTAGGYIFKYID